MRKPWACCQSADCCREPKAVVMTHAERAAIQRAAPDVVLMFDAEDDQRFVSLRARPCPLLNGNACSVYAVRPVNCRRYACGRDDVTAEPLDPNPIPLRFFQDRDFRRQMVLMQRKAMTQWGLSHGWGES